MRSRLVVLAMAALVPLACEQKKQPPPQPTYTMGSVNIALPPGVSVPYPQGKEDAPTVNATKCNFVVDRQIKFMTEANPQARAAITAAKPQIMQECETKWTQQQYDCMVAAKSLQDCLNCKAYQRPLERFS